jgi:hypothetical protein
MTFADDAGRVAWALIAIDERDLKLVAAGAADRLVSPEARAAAERIAHGTVRADDATRRAVQTPEFTRAVQRGDLVEVRHLLGVPLP